VKNFLLQPQNIYTQLSGNFSPIFSGLFSSICEQLVQIARNFSAFSRRFCIFPRDFLQGLTSGFAPNRQLVLLEHPCILEGWIDK